MARSSPHRYRQVERGYGHDQNRREPRRSRYEEEQYLEDYPQSRRYERDYDEEPRNRRRSNARNRRSGGWFGDKSGHSEAAQKGWDNPNHAPSGWFGDAEGHATAARKGWNKPDHAPSGWFGDSEGHAAAARKGWNKRNRARARRNSY